MLFLCMYTCWLHVDTESLLRLWTNDWNQQTKNSWWVRQKMAEKHQLSKDGGGCLNTGGFPGRKRKIEGIFWAIAWRWCRKHKLRSLTGLESELSPFTAMWPWLSHWSICASIPSPIRRGWVPTLPGSLWWLNQIMCKWLAQRECSRKDKSIRLREGEESKRRFGGRPRSGRLEVCLKLSHLALWLSVSVILAETPWSPPLWSWFLEVAATAALWVVVMVGGGGGWKDG